MTLNLTPETITDAILHNAYDQLATKTDIINYFAEEMHIELDTPINRDDLAYAIDTDIRDMLHNNNLDMILILTPDDDYESLEDQLRANFDPILTADALLARCID
jgi:hypothetical protein